MLNFQKYRDVVSSLWWVNRIAAKAGVETLRHRIKPGSRPNSWSLPFESTLRVMMLGAPKTEVIDVQQIRSPIDHLTQLPLLKLAQRKAVDVGGVPGEWVWAKNKTLAFPAERTILFLHGGGYVFGSPTSHRLVTAAVTKSTNAPLLAIDYRLAPEHPYPAALEDAWTAYWWLLQQGVAPGSIVVMGDSAGGGLSVALMLALRDCGAPLPGAGVLLSPWLDLTLDAIPIQTNIATDFVTEPVLRSAARMYAGQHDLRESLISPLFADLRGLPPLLIQAGSAELLVEDARRFTDRALAAGVKVQFEEWEDMVHVFQFWHLIEARARLAVEHIGNFVHSL